MQPYHGYSSPPPPPLSMNNVIIASTSSSSSSANNLPPPPPPTASTRLLVDFPSLSTCSETDIKDLLVDDRFTEAVIQVDVREVREALDEQERLAKENEEIAKHNLSLQSELIALRTSTASAYATAQHLKDRWHEIEARQAAIYQRHRPSFLHTRLRHALQDVDRQTEQLAAAFIEGSSGSGSNGFMDVGDRGASPEMIRQGGGGGDSASPIGAASGNGSAANSSTTNPMSVDEFVRSFRAQRKVYHKRAMWCERWTRGEVAWRDD